MIQVIIKRKNHDIVEITMKGHAMYDDYGKDIVCAGASAILTTTVNAILMFDSKAIEVEENSGVQLRIFGHDDITQKLLLNMIQELRELESDYKKNINIKEDNDE